MTASTGPQYLISHYSLSGRCSRGVGLGQRASTWHGADLRECVFAASSRPHRIVQSCQGEACCWPNERSVERSCDAVGEVELHLDTQPEERERSSKGWFAAGLTNTASPTTRTRTSKTRLQVWIQSSPVPHPVRASKLHRRRKRPFLGLEIHDKRLPFCRFFETRPP
jgi:hypothetical protein